MPIEFRLFYRYVVMLLSICLIVSLIGPNFAEATPGETKRVSKKEKVTANIGEIPNKLPKEKVELTSKRTPFSKRYLNPDGSFSEEIFMEQQFYQDSSDKKWKKVNNKLKKSTKRTGKFENTSSNVSTFFAEQSGNNELVTVDKNEKSVSFVPVKANKVKGAIKDNEVTFKEILPDVDFRYSVHGSAVKEDIVLHQYQNENTFSFELKMKGVTPHKEKNGTIIFKDSKGKTIWFFEEPYMTDAKGKYTEKVSLELRAEKGKTFVDVIANQEFLKDPKTEYPVTIDPTINDWDVIRDSFIASSFSSSAYSSETFMNTGYHGYFGSSRALIQFVLPSLPSDSVISNATFNAYQAKSDASTASIDLFRVTSNWSATTATWNAQPSLGGSPESTTTDNKVNAYWQWDITKLAKDWYNGVQANYGMMLKQQNETTSPYRSFNSVNSGNNTPRITVNYTVAGIGLESFWMTTKNGVNPANGNLVYQDTDVEIPGRGPEVSLARTFNSRKSSFKGLFGYGWITNLEPFLVDSGSGPITFIDGDNTRHIFGEKLGGGYEAAGGIYLDLVKNNDETYTITETDGTKTNFNKNGKISSIVDTNDNKTIFVYDTSGKLTKIQDASGRETTVTHNTNGYVSSVTDPANHTTSYEYDASGNLTKVTNPEGKATTFSYDTDHNITGITDARNTKTTVGYDASDRVSSISHPITINGATETSKTTYSYDSTNLVTSETDGEGKRIDYTTNTNGNVVQTTENPLDTVNKVVTTYSYDNNNNLTKVVDANTNKTNGTAAYVYTYDEKGNITGVQLPENQNSTFEYDSQNNLTKEQNFNQNVSSYDYDADNNQTEATDPNVQTSASRYDSKGNLLYDTHPMSAVDNMLANSSFEFDQNSDNWPDNWEQLKDTGSTANFAWSSTSKFGGKGVSIANPTSWAVVRSDKFDYTTGEKYIASAYLKTSSTVGNALLKIEFFDDQNNWLGQEFSSGLKGTHDWTRLQTVIDNVPANTKKISVAVGLNAGSGTANFEGVQLEKGTNLSAYNLVDNSSIERYQDGKPTNWVTSSNLSVNDKVVQNENSEDDNVFIGKSSFQMTGEAGKNKYIKQHINVSGDANSKYTLSGWSKQVSANSNGGDYAIQVAINYKDGTTDWDYGNDFDKAASGWQHVAAEVKAKKEFNSIDVYYYYYNQSGTAWFDAMRLENGASISSNTYDANGNYVISVKDQIGESVSYSYDTVGNRTSIKDSKGQTTSFDYDSRNLLTKVTDANLGVMSYSYDGNGNRTAVNDAKDNLTKYDYNEFNLLSKITNPLNQVTQFEYDRNGNQTKVVLPKGNTISSSFDALNRLNSTYVNGVKKWDYAYDLNRNLTSVIDASGKQTTFSYDKNNLLKQEVKGSIKTDYGYDPNDNLTSVKFTAGTTSISTELAYNKLDQLTELARNGVNQVKLVYDERGKVTSMKRANNTYTSQNYDDANRLIESKNYKKDGTVLDSYKYSYDPNGNHISIVTNNGNVSYEYDSLNQLKNEILTDGTVISYEYDAVGNRTKKTVTKGTTKTTTSYTYNAGNELTNVNGQTYTHDQNGNITNNGDKTYIYNEENQLIEVKDKTGASVTKNNYDHEGNRTSITTSTGTTYFHYDGDKVIAETDTNNNITAEYSWDTEGNPITMTRSGKVYYYHLNGHGDVTALTDENGNVVAEYQYDAWGNVISQSGTMASSNPYRYAGYRFDEATGLYYLLSRYYDSNIGRFLTRDTFHGYVNTPLSLNQYAYSENNPVMLIDPDGHSAVGTIKTVTVKVSAASLKRKMKAAKITSYLVKGPINEILGGAVGHGAKTKFGAGLRGLSTYALVSVIGLGAKKQIEETKAFLKKIKSNHAAGIVIKQKYRYSYMNGAGTGWYTYGKASVSLYY
ncbi:DNRLRE domain-containing protein [Peribacillus frigoritolerans]|uniref:DNRLRE domain-containing protein n=1 Tax=Peribacillus frigoritolerans TaxID=450367 RepID=UPI0024C1ED36|nr:DNRLRE domain-containing protein [Peribacillus frigoritolerans]WHX59892.1 DNRLRE domain-containing protein [Peribacillus frigoritolerans]